MNWTPDKVRYLCTHYADTDNTILALHLSTTPGAVQAAGSNRGLYKSAAYTHAQRVKAGNTKPRIQHPPIVKDPWGWSRLIKENSVIWLA